MHIFEFIDSTFFTSNNMSGLFKGGQSGRYSFHHFLGGFLDILLA